MLFVVSKGIMNQYTPEKYQSSRSNSAMPARDRFCFLVSILYCTVEMMAALGAVFGSTFCVLVDTQFFLDCTAGENRDSRNLVMQRFNAAFESASRRINSMSRKTRDDMLARRLPDEPDVTSALVTRLRDAFDGYQKAGIKWSAKILSSHGPGAEESVFGADFLGVLQIDFPDFRIRKGFLAHAKKQDEGKKLSTDDWKRLREQCEKMMNVSNTSFVFIYSQNGFFVVPAISVLACGGPEDLHTLHPMKIHQFYRQHFYCFVGDYDIRSSSQSALRELGCRRGLELIATSPDSSEPSLFDDDGVGDAEKAG